MRYKVASHLVVFLAFVCTAMVGSAQSLEKLSPLLTIEMSKGHSLTTIRLMIRGHQLPDILESPIYKSRKIADYDSVSFYIIEASKRDLLEKILPLPTVLFVDDGLRAPNEEVIVNNLDLAVNLISTTHNKYPQWNGSGVTFSLKENRPDTADIDFAGRYIPTTLTSKTVSSHASNMATMVAGGGNSWYLGRGAAWASDITSSDFANLLPDAVNILQQHNISVQNHSYGVGVESFYGADASLYDASLLNNTLVHVFSSGNSGTLSAATGSYASLPGYANITGSFKMAKNIITVGATDSFHTVVAQSSKGPAHDGRVKPELVAFGLDGSSGAAALTSGVALMLQQQYKQLYGQLPENTLVKAVLLNSADDRGTKEVDYANGFGSLNALNAIRTFAGQRFAKGIMVQNGTQAFAVSVPPGIKKIKATLVWNDPPAASNASKALVKDLDLEIKNTSTNERWLPWVLNKFPHVDSLKLPATRKRDSLNNVEQVTIDNPIAGAYELVIKGYNVNAATQSFSIAYQFDSSDVFEWHFPRAADPVFPSAANTLRWKSSFLNTTGKLDISTDNGTTWQLINPTVDLARGYYNWTAPGVNNKALLKMQVNNIDFVTDTFVMAARTPTGIGFNCPDSFLFYWKKITGADSFRVFTLGSKYLVPIVTTVDSFKVFLKSTFPSKYYAVAPVLNNREGSKSYTLDYTLQGVDCYVRSFLATLAGDVAELGLSLGSLYNITKVTLEKFNGSIFVPLETRQNLSSTQIDFEDADLKQGLNTYRVRIELAGGGLAYTSVESVFYFDDERYVVYPNPAPQGQTIHIAQLDVDVAVMQVFTSAGVKVFEKTLDDRINSIPANRLSKGVHFIRILNNNRAEKTLKLIVY